MVIAIEYYLVIAIYFTDKKFQDGEWHPHHQWKNTSKALVRSGPPLLKHHEYQTSKGVPFPSATGNLGWKDNMAHDEW